MPKPPGTPSACTSHRDSAPRSMASPPPDENQTQGSIRSSSPPITDEIVGAFRPGSPLPHVRETRNSPAVRVGRGVFQAALQFPHYFFAEHMLNLFGILMNVVSRDLCGIRQVEFPKAMIAHDGT